MTRLFQIQHEPITIVVVPGIFLVELGDTGPRIRRACVGSIPMCHHVQPIGVNHRHLHQNHFVAKALKLWRFVSQHAVGQMGSLLHRGHFGCVQSGINPHNRLPFPGEFCCFFFGGLTQGKASADILKLFQLRQIFRT